MTKSPILKTISLTLCVVLLIFMVGRPQRVSAMAVVGTAAVSAALTVGAAYMVYVTLTGGSFDLPNARDVSISDYIHSVGTEAISRSPFLQKEYAKMYQYCLEHPNDWSTSLILDFDQDLLRGIYNDLKSVDDLQSIGSYDLTIDALNGFSYSFSFVDVPLTVNGTSTTLSQLGYVEYTGQRVVYPNSTTYINSHGTACIINSDLVGTYRNVLNRNGTYSIQVLNPSTGVYYGVTYKFHGGYYLPNTQRVALPVYNTSDYLTYWQVRNTGGYAYDSTGTYPYPVLVDAPIYVVAEDRYLPVVDPNSNSIQKTPNWLMPNNDDDYYLPYVPFVELPSDPHSNLPSKWGIKWSDLWNTLLALAGDTLDASIIASLINALAGDNTLNIDLEYSPYNDNSTNYYIYYSDTYNVDDYSKTYNYNITDSEHVMPVNLNEISQYTDNDYLKQLEETAKAGSSILRDYTVFWYNVDPALVYLVFGTFILILVAAFVGKWGHS